jgi:hypothetical protein
MIFEYFTYLLVLNLWTSTAVKAELIYEPSSDLQNGTSDIVLSETSQGKSYSPRYDFDLIEEGYLGDWNEPYEAPDGYFACGLAIRNEDYQKNVDDTANNALRLIFCNSKNWWDQFTRELNQGEWGSWGSDYKCPQGTYINGARVKIEEWDEKVDMSAMNGIEIFCKNPQINDSKITSIEVVPSKWGSWGQLVTKDRYYVCGGQVRFHNRSDGDDTALNGVRFKFCEFKIPDGFASIIDGSWGTWTQEVVAPSEYLACGLKLRMDPYTLNSDNTGLNGIKVKFCNINNWSKQSESTVNEGLYGDWGNYMMCDQGYFINAIQVKIQGNQGPGNDDYSLTGLAYTCNSPSDPGKISSHSQDINVGDLQGFKVYDKSYLCGLQGRFDFTTKGNDATGLNGIRVKVCDFTYDLIDYTIVTEGNFGQWLKPQVAPKD